ncbi:hypothetical protein KA071_01325 [Candidatus Gracilibacteria bacterium]|nr:hypothetical protein [Candidatus Gracilibacteria bacterium]
MIDSLETNAGPRSFLQNHEFVVRSHNPLIQEWMEHFDYEKFVDDLSRKYPKTPFTLKFTGYPFLLYLIERIFGQDIQNKSILEIGGGSLYGEGVLQYLNDTGAFAIGIDARSGKNLAFSEKKRGTISRGEWKNLPSEYGQELWDCIFHHRIGIGNNDLENTTNEALKSGGYYIAFKRHGSGPENPVNKNQLLEKGYQDFSFSLDFPEGAFMEDSGYEVTVLRKPVPLVDHAHRTKNTVFSILGGLKTI